MGWLRTRLAHMPRPARWAAFSVVALLAAFAVWFFFLRASGQKAISQPPPPRPAIGQTITFQQYVSTIDNALNDVRAAKSASGNERNQFIQSAITSLDKVEGGLVTPPSETATAEIDNTVVISEMRTDKPNLNSVESSLSILSQSLKSDSRQFIAGTLDGSQSSNTLKQVLNDPTFDYERGLSPLQRLAKWLASLTGEADPNDTLWRWALAFIASVAAGATTFLASERLGNRWVRLALSIAVGLTVGLFFYAGLRSLDIVAQMLGAVGIIVAAIAVAVIMAGVHRAAAPPARSQRISELAAVLGMSASQARSHAGESAQAGDFRSAIRYRCLAVLLALDEVGKLHFDRAATNREYLYRAPGDMQNNLQPLLARFDAIWYGNAPATAEEWTDYTARAAQIEAAIAQSSNKPARSAA